METGRPRSKSAFSFRSSKSDKSDKAKPKIDLHETQAEKRKAKFNENTKKNPNSAMNEAQPSVAALEKTTLTDIRSIQHRDAFGNVIVDADLSNPTRSRFERPLDTIRSFEAAVDNSYKRRSHMPQTESYSANDSPSSRRSSYYGGYENHNPRAPHNGGHSKRPDSVADNYGSGPPTPTRSRAYGHRVGSDPTLSRMNGQGVYPVPGYHQSHDTVTTGISNGSHTTEPWGNSTDPSSENSSIDRVNALNRADHGDGYVNGGYVNGGYVNGGYVNGGYVNGGYVNGSYAGHGSQQQFQGPIMEEYGGHNGGAYPQPGYSSHDTRNVAYGDGGYSTQQMSSPISPPQRGIIKLGGSGDPDSASPNTYGSSQPQRPAMARAPSDKRKGWFKRKFAKD